MCMINPSGRLRRPRRGPLPPTGALLLLGSVLLSSLPSTLRASGTRVGFKDPFATARGDAFVATADDPAAVYYNPAGMTQLQGQNLSTSVYLVSLGVDYRSATTGVTTAMHRQHKVLPQVYYTWTAPDQRWAVGVGFFAPFGLSTDWPTSTGFRTFATRNEETYYTFNPVFAWKINDQWSVGGGLTFNRLDVDLRRGIGLMPGDQFRFKAHGTDVSFNLGIRWQPSPQHAFGLSYRHQTSFDLTGTADSAPYILGEHATAQLPFPEVLVAGYSYRPTPQWNLEFDLDWTNWSRVNTLVVSKPSGPIALPLDWKSGFFYELGATRYLRGGWLVSAGYTYTDNSVPDSTWNPAIPDANRQFFSAGVGYVRGRVRIMLALQHALTPTRRIHGDINPLTGENADGSYNVSVDTCSLGLDFHF